jgi:hypothetical protein
MFVAADAKVHLIACGSQNWEYHREFFRSTGLESDCIGRSRSLLRQAPALANGWGYLMVLPDHCYAQILPRRWFHLPKQRAGSFITI